MKKILSVFVLLLFCLLAAACGSNNSKNLKEVVRYECGPEGFYIIKGYFDRKGNCLEERYYDIDSELDIIDCKIIAYNTFDKKGNIVKAEGHYISNPYYATPETVLVIEAIDHEEYDYKVVDEAGNVNLYIKETKNENGKVTREEYYTRGGRFIRVDEYEFREDGTLRAYRGKNARNEFEYETLCDERGNFLVSTRYDDETGRPLSEVAAEYYENGAIKAYYTTAIYKNDSKGDATALVEFYEDGRISKSFGKEYLYDEDGKLFSIRRQIDYFNFDENGYLVSYSGRANGQIDTNIGIQYKYDAQGRLTSCVTKNALNGSKITIAYQYREDGSMIIRHTNVYGITNNIIYTDAKGRVILSEVYNNVSRTSHETIEYDVYGNVIKRCEYDQGQLSNEHFYEYNEHGDLLKKESKAYSSGGFRLTSEEYEYFENGYVKSVVYRDRDEITDTKLYDENGGYTYTIYSILAKGEKHMERTYDRYGNELKTVSFGVSFGKDYDEIIIREYYPDDTEKKRVRYFGDVLKNGTEFNEYGKIVKNYERNEDGTYTVEEYTYEKGIYIKDSFTYTVPTIE